MEARFGCAQEARGIGTIAANNRLTSGGVHDDELIDQRRIAWQWVSEQVLADTQTHADDLPKVRRERGRLNPHVMSKEWCQGCSDREQRKFHIVLVCTERPSQ